LRAQSPGARQKNPDQHGVSLTYVQNKNATFGYNQAQMVVTKSILRPVPQCLDHIFDFRSPHTPWQTKPMNPKLSWFDRKFDFNFPPAKFPEIFVRLEGASLGIELALQEADDNTIKSRFQDSWSMLENVGHLATLEPLWIGRVEDILARKPIMRQADLTNQATNDARFNDQSIQSVLDSFKNLRITFLDCLRRIDSSQWAAASEHPRLKTPMRLVDLCYFVAEHDEYHLARIEELKSLSTNL
jgi:uncharacterized damage-inducible protein DinB